MRLFFIVLFVTGPGCIIGSALCLTLIGIPVGAALAVASARPAAKEINRMQSVRVPTKDNFNTDEEEVPWSLMLP